MQFGLSYNDTSYTTGAFVGSRTYGWTGTWLHDIGELRKLNLTVDGSYNRGDGAGATDTDSYGIRLGREWRFTERITFDTLTGIRYLEATSVANGETHSFGILTQAAIRYRDEFNTATGEVTRDIRPSAAGGTLEEDKLGLSYGRRFTETLTLSVDGNLAMSEAPGSGAGGSSKRDSYTVGPTLQWQFAERWILSGSLSRRSQKLGTGGTATANSANVSVQLTLP